MGRRHRAGCGPGGGSGGAHYSFPSIAAEWGGGIVRAAVWAAVNYPAGFELGALELALGVQFYGYADAQGAAEGIGDAVS